VKLAIVEFIGAVLIVAGVGMVYPPAALMVAGALLVLVAFVADRGGSR